MGDLENTKKGDQVEVWEYCSGFGGSMIITGLATVTRTTKTLIWTDNRDGAWNRKDGRPKGPRSDKWSDVRPRIKVASDGTQKALKLQQGENDKAQLRHVIRKNIEGGGLDSLDLRELKRIAVATDTGEIFR